MNNFIAVLGFGVTGKDVATHFLKNGDKVFVYDDNYSKQLVEDGIKFSNMYKDKFEIVLNPKFEVDLDKFDKVILSPSFKLDKKYIKGSFDNVYSELDYFYEFFKDKKIIAVTGTDGKTTFVKMLTELLRQKQKTVFLGGNVGIPLMNYINNDVDYEFVVLELSSFQLYYSKRFKCDYGILLNIADDHLTWHKDFNDYLESKTKIFDMLKEKGIGYCHESVNERGRKEVVDHIKNIESVKFFGTDKENEIVLKGETIDFKSFTSNLSNLDRNKKVLLENYPPLIGVCMQFGFNIDEIVLLLNNFKLEPFRLNEVKINDNLFVNDSKSTNIHTTVFAVKNYPNSIVILGGDDKQLNYAEFIDGFNKYGIKEVICFGGLKDKLFSILNPHFKCLKFNILDDVFKYLKENITKNDVVLFSPGSSSFDLYKDYKGRGHHFDELLEQFFGKL